MDPFELEPWSMFSNDFIGSDSDNLLPDELLQQQQQQQDQMPGNDGGVVDANDLLTDVKCEPMEPLTDEVGGEDVLASEAQERNVTNVQGNASTAKDYDDNEIFNFGLESAHKDATKENVDAARDARDSMSSPAAHLRQRDKINTTNLSNQTVINYERYVVYICPACGGEFDVQALWKRHINTVHHFNTRRGLNFVQVDKLYHRCLECHKRIAMHAMENLLKHKFTHLPYRCAKCKICLRHYKYRQDLIVHLRTVHHDEVLRMSAESEASSSNGGIQQDSGSSTMNRMSGLEIRDIKGNAVDIFEGTLDESIKVKNELLDDSDSNMICESNAEQPVHNDAMLHNAENLETLQKYIIYLCPKCGTEHATFLEWMHHIERMHNYTRMQGLNFKQIHDNVVCLECNTMLQGTSVQSMQKHKFTHLPHSATLRCNLCRRLFNDRRGIMRHLKEQHCIDDDDADGAHNNSNWTQPNCQYKDTMWDNQNDDNDSDDAALFDNSRNDERDMYEPHIEYLCPQCGRDFYEKKHWRRHIIKRHQLTDLKVLNFRVISEREVQCLECLKVITNAYGVQNAQQHRITHMPYKAYIRCRLCVKAYTDRKGVVKHLRTLHGIRPTTHSAAFLQTHEKPPTAMPPKASSSSSFLESRPVRSPAQPKAPFKEIVRHAQYTYEIKYLDEEDDNSNLETESHHNSSSSYNKRHSSHYDEHDDNTLLTFDDTPVPELMFGDSSYNVSSSGARSEFERSHRRSLQTQHQRSNRMEQHNMRRMNQSLPHGSSSNSSGNNAMNKYSQHDDDEQQLSGDETLLIPSLSSGVSEDAVTHSRDSSLASQRVNWSNYEQYFSFLCPSCGVEYKTQTDWRKHINNVHHFDKRQHLGFRPIDKHRFLCLQCHVVFVKTKLKGLQEHKFRHLPFKLYIKCTLCSTRYNHKPNMISHLRMRHNIVIPASEYPVAASTRSRAANAQNERDDGVGVADVDGDGGGNDGGAGAGKAAPSCATASSGSFYNNAVDHESIAYFCPQCNLNFESHVKWRFHIVTDHNLNSRNGLNFLQIDEHHFLCLECYKRVTVTHNKGAIGQLQSHKFRHLPYKSFHCTACGVEFVRKQMFFKHLNKITKLCDAAGNTMAKNNSHTNVHNSTRDDGEHEANEQASNVPINDTNTNIDAELLPSTDEEFILLCPDCGEQFQTWRPWREHINITHQLGRRDKLRFRMFNPHVHQCVDCREYVSGRKLRDLQAHRFKHLPYGGAYIRCRHCKSAFQSMRTLQQHLFVKHSKTKVAKKSHNDDCAPDEEAGSEHSEEKVILSDDDDDYDDENTNMTNNTSTTTTTAAVVNESSSDNIAEEHEEGNLKKKQVQKHAMRETSEIITGDNQDDDDDDDDDHDGDCDDDDDDDVDVGSNRIVNQEPVDVDGDDDDEAEYVDYSDADEQYLLG